MTNMLKRLFIVSVAFCMCLLSFASCSGGIDKEQARAFISDFYSAIVDEDYDKAETFLHPERPADLEAFFQSIEANENIDFQAGIKVERYTNSSSAYYDSTVDGSTYELTMKTKVGTEEVEFTIEIVQNENGYGIYNLDIDT